LPKGREGGCDQIGIEDLAFRPRVNGIGPKHTRSRRGAVPIDHCDARLALDFGERRIGLGLPGQRDAHVHEDQERDAGAQRSELFHVLRGHWAVGAEVDDDGLEPHEVARRPVGG